MPSKISEPETHTVSLGDYDGDLMEAFWQPTIVQQFKPADQRFANEPPGLARCLVTENESVQEFETRMTKMQASTEDRIFELQGYLLRSLCKADRVGRYSVFWENSIYTNGYRHPKTILMANM